MLEAQSFTSATDINLTYARPQANSGETTRYPAYLPS
jgi:sulfonate dioxygenase